MTVIGPTRENAIAQAALVINAAMAIPQDRTHPINIIADAVSILFFACESAEAHDQLEDTVVASLIAAGWSAQSAEAFTEMTAEAGNLLPTEVEEAVARLELMRCVFGDSDGPRKQ